MRDPKTGEVSEGWAQHLTCHRLAYAFTDTETVVLLDWEECYLWLLDHKDEYRKVDQKIRPNERRIAAGYIVPIADLMAAPFRCQRWQRSHGQWHSMREPMAKAA